jgi:hypothetical protein
LDGSTLRGPQVRLVVDPVEGRGQHVGLHREELEQQPNGILLASIERRHASPLSLQSTIRVD